LSAAPPNLQAGAALVIRQGEKELWIRHAPETEPEVTVFRARVKKDHLVLAWKIKSTCEGEPEVWVQWSNDCGKTWNALTTGLCGNEATLGISNLPSGRIQLRLSASDGFHTAVSEQVALEIPERAPEVSVLTPRSGQTFVEGGTMRVWGMGTSSNGEDVSDFNAQWLLDGQEVAYGFDAFIEVPNPGEHRLTLVVTADQAKAQVTVEFRTVEVPRECHESE
jgi:hypothetical protein